MSIRGVLGVLSELPGVAGVATSTMPGIRPAAADSPCIQIRILVCLWVLAESHLGSVGCLVDSGRSGPASRDDSRDSRGDREGQHVRRDPNLGRIPNRERQTEREREREKLRETKLGEKK